MGYYTDFSLRVFDIYNGERKSFITYLNEKTIEDWANRNEDRNVEHYVKMCKYLEDNRDAFYGIFCGNVKWYDYESSMITLSQKFPDCLFVLEGSGEEQGDLWKHYFLNGKHKKVYAVLTIPEVELEELK